MTRRNNTTVQIIFETPLVLGSAGDPQFGGQLSTLSEHFKAGNDQLRRGRRSKKKGIIANVWLVFRVVSYAR